MKKKPRAYSREKRKEQIIGLFDEWSGKDDYEAKTMNAIAKALGMVASQHVTDMLLELCEEKKLGFVERKKFGRWDARGYYSMIKTLITEKSFRRQITLRKRGVAVGQLEMFS